MTKFSEALNTDTNDKLTSARYDDDLGKWVNDVGNYVQNDSGVWIPQTATNDGHVRMNVENFPEIQDVQLSGSIPRKTEIETLVNAESVSAGSNTGEIDLKVTDEEEIFLLVNIDKQPWKMDATSLYFTAVTKCFFPLRASDESVYLSTNAPALSLYLGLNATSNSGLTEPTDLTTARQISVVPTDATVKVMNDSDDTATVSIKVLRVWG